MCHKIPKDRYVMIIGAMKCGTSSLYDYLIQHPQICPCKTKEPEYFSENQSHKIKCETYEELFEFNENAHKYTLEASTGYTKYPLEMNVPKNIYNYGIKPKLIYIVRNPIDRIESHYNFMQRNENWSLEVLDSHLIKVCDYFTQIKHFEEYFDKKDILVLDFEELKNSPIKVLHEIYQFLGLDNGFYPNFFEVKNKTRPISKLERKLKRIGFDKVFKLLPNRCKKYAKIIIQIVLKPQKRKLTKDEEVYIRSKLSDNIKLFGKEYDFDVKKWRF